MRFLFRCLLFLKSAPWMDNEHAFGGIPFAEAVISDTNKCFIL